MEKLTKEQILDKHHKKNMVFATSNETHTSLDAMVEYAEQQVDDALHAERNKLQLRFSELSLEVAKISINNKKLVEGLKLAIMVLGANDMINTCEELEKILLENGKLINEG